MRSNPLPITHWCKRCDSEPNRDCRMFGHEIESIDDSEIRVGDRVRSFDFPDRCRDLEGERACFVEGRVVDIRNLDFCDRYVIVPDRIVWAGKERPEHNSKYFYPPVNGTKSLFSGDVCSGVEKI